MLGTSYPAAAAGLGDPGAPGPAAPGSMRIAIPGPGPASDASSPLPTPAQQAVASPTVQALLAKRSEEVLALAHDTLRDTIIAGCSDGSLRVSSCPVAAATCPRCAFATTRATRGQAGLAPWASLLTGSWGLWCCFALSTHAA